MSAMAQLTDFLLARIAEDEQAASEYQEMLDARQRELQAMWARGVSPAIALYDFSLPGGAGDPARVLAECDAKRRIVSRYVEAWNGINLFDGEEYENIILPLLALPYAGHPDYRPEWKP